MLVKTPDTSAIVAAADAVGVDLYNLRQITPLSRRTGRATYRFRIVPRTRDQQRLNSRGRRVHGCTWSVHRDFFLALFELDEHAYVEAALATYNGRADFLKKYPSTYFTPVARGWQAEPVAYGTL